MDREQVKIGRRYVLLRRETYLDFVAEKRKLDDERKQALKQTVAFYKVKSAELTAKYREDVKGLASKEAQEKKGTKSLWG